MESETFSSRQDMRNRVYELLEELAQVEQQQEDTTLPRSDQELLDKAWEDLNDRISYLQEIIEMGEEIDEAFQRENEEFDNDSWKSYSDDEDEEEKFPQSHTIQKVYRIGEQIYVTQEELDDIKEERKAADYYETDYGVYYNASDEV